MLHTIIGLKKLFQQKITQRHVERYASAIYRTEKKDK
jgi:hypothetical protein